MKSTNESVAISRTPKSPLGILQAELEAIIQLVVYTLALYQRVRVQLLQGKLATMSDLGYEGPLCNMALVNAVAAWEGFKRKTVKIIRANGHNFSEKRLDKRLKQTSTYGETKEPIARRDCIAHNLARVDPKYKKQIPKSLLNIGDGLDINLPYLKDASHTLFKTAVEVVKLLVADNLLGEEQQKTLGEFQRDPVVKWLS